MSIVDFGVSLGTVFLGAWAFMLAVGNIHSALIPALNPIGYWNAVGIVAPILAFTAAIRLYNNDNE